MSSRAPESERHRRESLSSIRRQNEADFAPAARSAVEQMLSAGHSHPWTYVYELTQNAIDADARRVAWQQTGQDTVVFRHDGVQALDEEHVRALASLGQSTKGLAAIGFMGVGFKSVFARFRRARVSGFGWRFRFHIATERGDLGTRVTRWFDTLLPEWDEESPPLNPGTDYTTAFQLSHPADPDRPLTADLDRLAAPDDPIPLAVLALRGLKEVRIDDATWHLSAKENLVEVRSSATGRLFRWQSFASRYRPGDDEMRAFLEARRKLKEQRDAQGQRPERQVIALLPLDSTGRPAPPDRGHAYATLPTQTPVPFGFHLQADWLVDLDRQNLRPIEENAWQQTIVRQVPELVRQILVWLKKQPEESKERGYRLLADPTKVDDPLSEALGHLQQDFAHAISDLNVVPIHGGTTRSYCTLAASARLPGQFRDDFSRRPEWRPDLLFDRELVQERMLGRRGVDFLRWLGGARNVEEGDVRWSDTLPRWWNALAELPEDGRTDALFALWHGIKDREWNDVPAVPTEEGTWIAAQHSRFLNEEPPSANEPSGPAVEKALGSLLPQLDERLSAKLRNRVRLSPHHPGTAWLRNRQQDVNLAALVERACEATKDKDALPLVELLEWALNRGERRQNLVPLVMTEDGARRPREALLADPLVDHGRCRRDLFQSSPALVEDYAIIEDREAVILFLERLGVPGQVKLREVRTPSSDYWMVKRQIGAEPPRTRANGGYTVFDYEFPFPVADVPAEALQVWLSDKPSSLRLRGRKRAEGSFHGTKTSRGTTPCSWTLDLRRHAWLLCTDGERRKPGDALLSPHPDYENAPVADIDSELAEVLRQEGIAFGENIPKSPALRRLVLRGEEEMPDAELAGLFREVQEEYGAKLVTRAELDAALDGVKLHGVPLMSRAVRRCGPGEGLRSDLGGWVVPLSSVSDELAAVVGELVPSIPATTTGRQALDFLVHVWEERPAQVERVRRRIAAAYRYTLDDLDAEDLPLSHWEENRERACLYGQGQWRPVNASSLIVDDIQSPFIRQSLSGDRIAVAAAHLGETAQAVRRVAERLGIPLLSDQVRVQPGRALAHEPPWAGRVRSLVQALASLEDRQEIRAVTFHEGLTLRVENSERVLRAYADEDTLRLTGEPSRFAVEAADQLVDYFQLSQRGHAVAWLTGALFALEDSRSFRTHLKTLADGLGVVADLGDLEPNDDVPGAEPDAAPDPSDPKRISTRPAANQVAVFVESNGDGASKSNAASSTSAKGGTGPKSDKKARRAVVEFEKVQGREALEAPAGQPGFDVLSRDPETGRELRRIEVKGVEGRFEGRGPSVLLSARQVNDALQQEDGAEYWLYVVDSTDTVKPRVFPIPWTRWRGKLRYGFFAHAWSQHAVRPDGPPAED